MNPRHEPRSCWGGSTLFDPSLSALRSPSPPLLSSPHPLSQSDLPPLAEISLSRSVGCLGRSAAPLTSQATTSNSLPPLQREHRLLQLLELSAIQLLIFEPQRVPERPGQRLLQHPTSGARLSAGSGEGPAVSARPLLHHKSEARRRLQLGRQARAACGEKPGRCCGSPGTGTPSPRTLLYLPPGITQHTLL